MARDLPWKTFSEAYGFLGNSLLKPMTQTPTIGLDPTFWEAFPTFGDDAVAESVAACASFAQAAGEDDVEGVAVEYTRLFVGPPSPAAPPWETLYRAEGATVGFGEATFQMRALLRDAGLELSNENHQYEDHMGIELLYLCEMCRRQADELLTSGRKLAPIRDGETGEKSAPALRGETIEEPAPTLKGEAVEEPAAAPDEAALVAFINDHPLSWIEPLRERIMRAYPDGYLLGIVTLAERILAHQARLLA